MLLGKEIYHNVFHPEMDIYKDYLYINDRFFPIGYFAMEALNVTDESLALLDRYASAIKALSIPFLPGARKGFRNKLAVILPELRENVTNFIRTLCELPPFKSWNVEKEIEKVNEYFGDGALKKVLRLGLDGAFFFQYIDITTSAPTAIRDFRTAGRFLEENYLRGLPRRDEPNFATATYKCFHSDEFSNIALSQGMDVEAFKLFPSMRSRCSFAHNPDNEDQLIFLDTIAFDSYMDFFVYDLLNGMHHGHAPSKCQNCGRYFLTTDARTPKYCYRKAIQNPHYTCRQYGAMNQQKEKNANHPVFQIYKTRTSTIRKHHQRGKITDDVRQEALKVCEELRDRALLDNSFAMKEYLGLMEQEAVYAEADKRLGGSGSHDK